jgi:hypothetical protein
VHTTQPSWWGVQVSPWWNETFRIHTNTWDWLTLFTSMTCSKPTWILNIVCNVSSIKHLIISHMRRYNQSFHCCPFHTLTIDFILALSVIKASETYETIMSVTDKFSKTVTLISERNTMTVKDWAICLLNCLALLNWELFKAIISDQTENSCSVCEKNIQTAQGRSTILNCLSFTNRQQFWDNE